jgi:hypothetical protein
LELDVIAAVEDAEDDVLHVIRQAMVRGKHAVETGGVARRRAAGWPGLRLR